MQSLAYTYDNVGNILSITDTQGSKNYTMQYDALDRLANTWINNILYQYEFDSIGRIKRIVNGNTTMRAVYNGNIVHAPNEFFEDDAGAGIYNAEDINTGTKNRTFSFWIVKEKAENLTGVNLSMLFGDGQSSTGTINVSFPIMALVQSNYSSGGKYSLNISTDFDQNKFSDKFGVKIKSLSLASNDKTESTIELVIENDINVTVTDVNWSCNNGNKSSSSITMAGNSNTTVSIAYNYSSPGEKKLICNVTSADGNDNKTAEFEIKGLEIQNVTITELNTNQYRVKFDIFNYYYPLAVTWVVNSDGQTFTNSVSLGTNQSSAVTQDITYTSEGSKIVNISAYSGAIRDSEEYKFSIEALEIGRYERTDYNNTKKIISFILTNKWPQNLSTSWNLTDPSLKNSTYLNQNDTLMVLIETNYTTEGRKDETVNIYSGSFLTTLKDWFNIYIVEMLDLQVLSESVSSTISEIIARSDSGNKTISWQLDTGAENITSTQTISINESDKVLILIEHNYSSSGVYVTNASINTSSNQDHATGVAIT